MLIDRQTDSIAYLTQWSEIICETNAPLVCSGLKCNELSKPQMTGAATADTSI